MNKKLPNLYVNKIDKKINNNDIFFYSVLKEKNIKSKVIDPISVKNNVNINDKISELFNSPNYVYKMAVVITLRDNTVISTDVIGQTDGKLMTMNDDLIDIKDIKEIKF
jgi:hypothetical protein